MSLIQSGKIFNDGEQLTAGKLNQMISDATLSTTGVDGTTIIVNENDVLAVRTGGIGTSSLANDSVITNKLPDSTVTAVDGTPDGVTLPKLQNIEADKILGRTTTGDGVVEAVALNTDNAMANASATSLATDGSIKAYVDGEITDNGITQTAGSAPYFGCRAFASYDGVNGVLRTVGNGNLTVSRSSAGTYVFTFVTAMPDADYSIVTGGNFAGRSSYSYISALRTISKTDTSFTLQVQGGAPAGSTYDVSTVDVAVFR